MLWFGCPPCSGSIFGGAEIRLLKALSEYVGFKYRQVLVVVMVKSDVRLLSRW